MASFDRDGGKKTTIRRYSGESVGQGRSGGGENLGIDQRRSSASTLIDNLRRESAAIAALRNVQRELNRAPSPNREGYRRNSFDHHRKVPQPTGYYVPPPGYADPLRDNLEDEGNLKLEQSSSYEFPTERSRMGKWSGAYNDRRDWQNYPDQIRYHRGNGWNDHSHKFPSHRPFHSDDHLKKFMPTLSHHDWSVPQAKQILSHWATLATLLGGVQATLLAYYSKQEQTGSGEEDPVYRMVIAISCSGLFLEVYGALLAAGTIVASISLQAKNSQSNSGWGIGSSNQQTDRETLLNNGIFSFNGINPTQQPASSVPCLSPRASAILDRLTVLVGFLIPLGAVFELIGLAGYTAHYLGNSVAITMVLTLIIAILVTIAAGFLGIQAGNRAMRNQSNNT